MTVTQVNCQIPLHNVLEFQVDSWDKINDAKINYVWRAFFIQVCSQTPGSQVQQVAESYWVV